MLNERDDKYESDSPDDSEYHFSDDDISYEVDTETKPQEPEPTDKKENLINKLSANKKMLISGAAFLVLVYIVYKVVTPGSNVPSTDITAPPTDMTQPRTDIQQNLGNQTTALTQNTASQEAARPSQPTYQPAPAPQAPQAAPNYPDQQQAAAQVNMQQQIPQQIPAQQVTTRGTPPSEPNLQTPQVVNQSYPSAAVQPTYQPTNQVYPPQSIPAPQPAQQPANAFPPVAAGAQIPQAVQQNVTDMNDERQRLVAELQAQYVQSISEFNARNQNLQNQVQSLNNRVASMENELNQLVRALTQQNQMGVRPQAPTSPPQTVSRTVDREPPPRINYSVQAIIPGRAWLRTAGGETVTVAEGDTLRNIGKISKIDPYDGIVEINTGSKNITLSYGNGG